MTVPEDDLDRVRGEYTDADGALTIEDIEEDLEGAGFEGSSLDAFSQAIAGTEDLAASRESLLQAQQQAIESLSDGGAVEGEIVRAEDGFTAIGAPQNVEQEIVRSGPETGDVIARNVNTGTEGKIGEVDLPPEPDLAPAGGGS